MRRVRARKTLCSEGISSISGMRGGRRSVVLLFGRGCGLGPGGQFLLADEGLAFLMLVARASGMTPLPAPGQATLFTVLAILREVRERAVLTPTEIDVLSAALFGETRDDLRERLSLRDATLRKHASAILRKVARLGFEADSLDRLVSMLYMRATLDLVGAEGTRQSGGLPGPSESIRTRTSVVGRDGLAGK